MQVRHLRELLYGLDDDLEIVFEDNDTENLYWVDTCGEDTDDNGNTYVFLAGYKK